MQLIIFSRKSANSAEIDDIERNDRIIASMIN